MAFTTKDIRDNYERMDTEELLILAQRDLTEIARAELHAVLSERNVAPPAAPAELRPAKPLFSVRAPPIQDRVAAAVIDMAAATVIMGLVYLPLAPFFERLHEVLAGLAGWAYFLCRDGIPGQSVGKRLMKLKTVQQANWRRPTYAQSFWRNLSLYAAPFDGVTALLENRLRIGDQNAGTIVVRANVNPP